MKRIILILACCLFAISSYSQRQGVELSHYVFPEFTQGTVLMKSGQQYKASLNYNTISEEMIFEDKDKKLAIGKEEVERVDTVYILDRKFFPLDGKFVELVCRSGFDLYAEHRCEVQYPGKPAAYGGTSETSSISTYSGFISGGTVYELKLPDDYKTKPYTNYWLKRGGELKKFTNMKQLSKLYADRKDLFREYVSTHAVDYNDQESLVRFISFLEAS
ncbi:hypothetical protein EG832_02785 [bacterium]|nr:hypothetical protein [bacterium]